MSKTKIIATLGPASQAYNIIKRMAFCGMGVARINFSHGNNREKIRRSSILKLINRSRKHKIKILGDLQGYRIRVGRLKQPLRLKIGQTLFLTQDAVIGSKNLIPFDYPQDLKDIRRGEFIYIDDGNIELSVVSNLGRLLKVKVSVAGILKPFKGINIPAAKLRFQGLSDKDKNDILFCVNKKFDFIAQSFVRSAEDILKVREILKSHRSNCKVIAKIENRQGLENLDGIIRSSDGIMIARGDLGVSLPIYQVPILQKEIIKKCKQAGKFVITATQMLESMVENARPTRAEVSDVANAVLDGSDYVMLSAETAVGNYPAESVSMMQKIISFTEKNKSSL